MTGLAVRGDDGKLKRVGDLGQRSYARGAVSIYSFQVKHLSSEQKDVIAALSAPSQLDAQETMFLISRVFYAASARRGDVFMELLTAGLPKEV